MADIYKRQPVRSSQLAAVAERRFGDASVLCRTGDNERANGAQYLCGLVLEILLKAKLLSAYPQIGNKRQRDIPEADRDIWNLIWRSHDLTEMLNRLPQLEAAVRKSGERSGKPVEHYLKQVCATWTIHARYSPQSATIADAREMLSRVRILKEVLK